MTLDVLVIAFPSLVIFIAACELVVSHRTAKRQAEAQRVRDISPWMADPPSWDWPKGEG